MKGQGKREIPEKKKNALTNGIVRHDSHLRKSDLVKICLDDAEEYQGSSTLAELQEGTQGGTPSLHENFVTNYVDKDVLRISLGNGMETSEVDSISFAKLAYWSVKLCAAGIMALRYDTAIVLCQIGTTVAERLACSPSTKAIRVQSSAGSLQIFACGNRAGRCRWSVGFLGVLPFPPPFHSGAAPYSPRRPPVAQSIGTPPIWVAGGSGFKSRIVNAGGSVRMQQSIQAGDTCDNVSSPSQGEIAPGSCVSRRFIARTANGWNECLFSTRVGDFQIS
ncbi:hypothetical protein PR048_030160 [Dryococelus australis]|uniref:Uncharacterized protein n=1 Tax=Dryococelus australis TaxID=614101 RepID=A0ABQ9GC22_9NEOP|nr:hypothetical protein PR048_030160 [Dryococelus australis]